MTWTFGFSGNRKVGKLLSAHSGFLWLLKIDFLLSHFCQHEHVEGEELLCESLIHGERLIPGVSGRNHSEDLFLR